jgi:hypothetical protein
MTSRACSTLQVVSILVSILTKSAGHTGGQNSRSRIWTEVGGRRKEYNRSRPQRAGSKACANMKAARRERRAL